MPHASQIQRGRPKKESHFEEEVPMEILNPGPPPLRPLPRGFSYVDVGVPTTRRVDTKRMFSPPLPTTSSEVNPVKGLSYLSQESRQLLQEVKNVTSRNERLRAAESNRGTSTSERYSEGKENGLDSVTSTLDDVSSKLQYSYPSLNTGSVAVSYGRINKKRRIVTYRGSSRSEEKSTNSISQASLSESTEKRKSPSVVEEANCTATKSPKLELRAVAVQTESRPSRFSKFTERSAVKRTGELSRARSVELHATSDKKSDRRSHSAEVHVPCDQGRRRFLRERRAEEKPWRSHMKVTKDPGSKKEDQKETEKQDCDNDEEDPKKKPWRTNMKRHSEQKDITKDNWDAASKSQKCIRKSDSSLVRKYMKEKRERSKQAIRTRAMEENKKKEEQKKRLLILETERRSKYLENVVKNSTKVQSKSNLTIDILGEREGQQSLRQKLQELATESRLEKVLLQKQSHEDNEKVVELSKRSEQSSQKPPNISSATFNEAAQAPKASFAADERKPLVKKPTMNEHGLKTISAHSNPAANPLAAAAAFQPQRIDKRESTQNRATVSDVVRREGNDPADKLERHSDYIEIINHDDVPERDTSSSVPRGTEKMRRMVSEIFARHQSDLDFVRSLDVDVPHLPPPPPSASVPSSTAVREFLLSTFGGSRNVRSPIPVKHSGRSLKPEAVDEEDAMPPILHYADPPETQIPFNFISTVRRKMQSKDLKSVSSGTTNANGAAPAVVPVVETAAFSSGVLDLSAATISEGLLSTSITSSCFSKDKGNNKDLHKKGEKKLISREKKQEKKSLKPEQGREEATRTEFGGSSLDVPSALRLRFLTEMNQLASIEEAEKHLRQMKHISSMTQVHAEAANMAAYIKNLQRSGKGASKQPESRTEFEERIKRELESLVAGRIQKMLEQQNESARIKAEAAKQLSKLELSQSHARKQKKSISPEAEFNSYISESQSRVNSIKSSDVKSPIIDSTLKSLMSKTESNIPEMLNVIDKTEKSGEALPKTISEVIQHLASGDFSTSQNITNEIADELSASEYSAKFEDSDGTIKEASLDTMSSVRSFKKLTRAKNAVGHHAKSEDSSSSVGEMSSPLDSKLLAPSSSTLSVFSDGESFSRFSIHKFKQHLEQESLRAKHEYDLLKKKESLLIRRVKEELTRLETRKREFKESGDKSRVSSVKKKERAVLLELKNRRLEIDRLKHIIKEAEKERQLILKQQKKLLKESKFKSESSSPSMDDAAVSGNRMDLLQGSRGPTVKDDERKTSVSKDLRIAEKQIRHGLKKLERNKQFLNDRENDLLEKVKQLGMVVEKNKTSIVEAVTASQEESDASSSTSVATLTTVQDDINKLSTESDNSCERVACATSPSKMETLKKTMGTTLKTPLSPKMRRRRHSSADSDDSVSISQAETVSDHSDVEIRINVLRDELQRRILTAAKLKKQQRQKSKEKLRIQEDALKKQIEQYDKLIQETKENLEAGCAVTVVQPQIKTPRSTVAPPVSTTRRTLSPEDSRLSSLIKQNYQEESADVADTSSHHLAFNERVSSPTAPSQALIDIKIAPEEKFRETEGSEDLNYSDDFTSSSSSLASYAHVTVDVTVKALQASSEQEKEQKRNSVADRLTSAILDRLIQDTCRTYQGVLKNDRTTDSVPTSPAVGEESSSYAKPISSPGQRSPRPQDLMLTTFDISSDDDDDNYPPMMPSRDVVDKVDLDEHHEHDEFGGNFIDDDFGLTSIRQESEHIRQQQLLIEQEISRIQQETQIRRSIPNKPPPPYTPPSTPVKLLRLVAPKPVEKYVPSSRDELVALLGPITKAIYEARTSTNGDTMRKEDLHQLVSKSAGKGEAPPKEHEMFVTFMVDLVKEIVDDIFHHEETDQNPIWMSQSSLRKVHTNLPRNQEALVERVQREVLILFGFEKRSRRENLIVRWSQKRRDRVDQILVRELHSEEASWTDYRADEAKVKDRLAEAIFDNLIRDTCKTYKALMQP